MKKVYFRVDANKKIGSGHLTRCWHLSQELNARQIDCTFIVNEFDYFKFPHIGHISIAFIKAQNIDEDAIETKKLLKDGDCLILDSYLHDEKWEKTIAESVPRIVVWDDLANRKHYCDILIDCGNQRTEHDYLPLLTKTGTRLLLGSQFCPISQELRHFKKINEKKPNLLHLFFGSGDNGELTLYFFEKLKNALPQWSFHIAIANQLEPDMNNKWRSLKGNLDQIFIGQPMQESLKGCSVAFGAPGTTTWERAYLGIPSFYVAINSNQASILRELENKKICEFGGEIQADINKILSQFSDFLKKDLVKMGETGTQLIDGNGLTRIAQEILK